MDAVELRCVTRAREWKLSAHGITVVPRVQASPALIRLNQYTFGTPGAERRIRYVSMPMISDEYGPRVERKES